MDLLFARGSLRDFLQAQLEMVRTRVESISDDELLARSTDDLVFELSPSARVGASEIEDAAIDGSVNETTIEVQSLLPRGNPGGTIPVRGYAIRAVYAFQGDPRLFYYRPSQHLLVDVQGAVSGNEIRIAFERGGLDLTPEQAQAALDQQISRIRQMAGFVSTETAIHDAAVNGRIRQWVEDRKQRVMSRRDLAGKLGFPLTRRPDAPRPVPLQRKQLSMRPPARARRPPSNCPGG
jgi:hypothetical protein